MSDIIVTLIIITIVSFSSLYIFKEKKKGVKCIGCPLSKTCHKCNTNKIKRA